MNCLLIGFGNIGRGDDGLGPVIVNDIDQTDEYARINGKAITLFQLDVTLCDELRSADLAIFVDARADDLVDPLVVRKESIDSLHIMASHSSHTCSINGLLNLTKNLYGAAPECYTVMPKAYDLSFKEELSSKAVEAAELATTMIMEIIRKHGKVLSL